MAWVTEYDLGWHSTNKNGTIYLQIDGGSYKMPLTLKKGSLKLSKGVPDWESHVSQARCTFTIVNDLSDFYELMPLMTISNGQIRVVVTDETNPATKYLFEGFLNCEVVQQEMLHYSDLTLTASGLLNKLRYDHPADIDTLQYMTLIDIIDACLTMTGAAYDIYVDCDLYELNAALSSGQTLFNRTGVYTELFWNNNIERMSALDILESILKSFNCYLQWYEQSWRIIHYEKMTGTRNWVVYTTGVSYGYTDTGSVPTPAVIVPLAIHKAFGIIEQQGGSQMLSVVPGLQRLDVKLEQRDFYNLLNPDLSVCTDTTGAEPLLGRRDWLSFDSGAGISWGDRGESFQNIDRAIRRFGYDVSTGSLQLNGLTTRFTTSTNGYDTMLIIDFKFGVANPELLAGWFGESQLINNPQDTTITFYWYLCTYEAVIANRDFFWYNTGTEEWELVADGDEQTEYNTLQITVADMDPDLLTYNGTLKIPIGQIISTSSADQDDLDLVFRMGTELVDKSGETPQPAYVCYYGDFRAAVSGSPENNLLRGDINTDFLNKLEISLDMFDAGWNYRNSLIRPTSFNYLTNLWEDGDGGNTLAEVLLKSKFRLYRIARQKMSITYIDPLLPQWGLFYPMTDSKQGDKVFISLYDQFLPEFNKHTVELYEYDNSEDITLE
jgi:hypothetical protein